MTKNKEVVFNKSDYKSYKDFYEDIYIKLDAKGLRDFDDCPNLSYHADILNEFMWYNHYDDLRLVFIGFDLEEIKKQKTHEDYRWNLIFDVMEGFVKKYPNNTLEFRDE